jgi:predicted DNA-binding transcriptional regulator AlpA
MTQEETSIEALTENQLEALIGVKRKTLQGWRMRGIGPRWVRVGKRLVRYPVSSLQLWLNSQPSGGGRKTGG